MSPDYPHSTTTQPTLSATSGPMLLATWDPLELMWGQVTCIFRVSLSTTTDSFILLSEILISGPEIQS
jgi:hypothetical protein